MIAPENVKRPRNVMLVAAVAAFICLSVPTSAVADAFRLHFGTLTDGAKFPAAQIFDHSGCHGANRSPTLHWSHVPPGTKSLAVTIFDRDARHGRGWWHWVAWNIPTTRNNLPENASRTMAGALHQTRNDYGSNGYGGPCPPPGPAHHYIITLYALPKPNPGFPSSAQPGEIAAKIRSNAIAHTSVTLTYARSMQ